MKGTVVVVHNKTRVHSPLFSNSPNVVQSTHRHLTNIYKAHCECIDNTIISHSIYLKHFHRSASIRLQHPELALEFTFNSTLRSFRRAAIGQIIRNKIKWRAPNALTKNPRIASTKMTLTRNKDSRKTTPTTINKNGECFFQRVNNIKISYINQHKTIESHLRSFANIPHFST